MIRTMAAAFAMLALALLIPTKQASAQDPFAGAILGGAAGAIIGGGVTGRGSGAAMGALIGATTGALIASEGQRRRSGYYWYRGDCYIQDRYGDWYRVSRRHC